MNLQEVAAFTLVVAACLVICRYQDASFNIRSHLDTRQSHSTHAVPTPRLGGMAIFLSVVLTTTFFDGHLGGSYAKLIISAVPLVIVALWEDAVGQTSAPVRLAAAFMSALLVMVSLQSWLPRLDIPLLDPWMGGAVGVAVTALFIAGSVNAFNMIDGLNGLCGGVALFAFLAFNAIAAEAGFDFMTHTTMLLTAGMAGFLVFNFPFGKIFLGDTGAYLAGFILSCFTVSLTERFPEVSPWALFLVLAYPLSELCFTFLRRLALGASPFAPDQGHLHHLVLAAVQQSGWCGGASRWNNPLATLLIMPLAVCPMAYAVAYYSDPPRLLAGVLGYALLFAAVYVALWAYLRTARQDAPARRREADASRSNQVPGSVDFAGRSAKRGRAAGVRLQSRRR